LPIFRPQELEKPGAARPNTCALKAGKNTPAQTQPWISFYPCAAAAHEKCLYEEEKMLSHSRALIAATLVIGFSAPVMAQLSMRHYPTYFKYSDAAEKAMTETPNR
jgi:hypothetical protein